MGTGTSSGPPIPRPHNLEANLPGAASTVKLDRSAARRSLTAHSEPYNRRRFLRAPAGLWADCLGTYADTSWPIADHDGSVSGRGIAVDWTWLWTVCGRGQDTAVDCSRSRTVRGLIVTASTDCSWKGQRRGHAPCISRGRSASPARPLRGHDSLRSRRGKACTRIFQVLLHVEDSSRRKGNG